MNETLEQLEQFSRETCAFDCAFVVYTESLGASVNLVPEAQCKAGDKLDPCYQLFFVVRTSLTDLRGRSMGVERFSTWGGC
jgi:hypothetical protein